MAQQPRVAPPASQALHAVTRETAGFWSTRVVMKHCNSGTSLPGKDKPP